MSWKRIQLFLGELKLDSDWSGSVCSGSISKLSVSIESPALYSIIGKYCTGVKSSARDSRGARDP